MYFVGFTRGLYGYYEKPPNLVTFYDTLGIRRNILILNPGVPTGISFVDKYLLVDITYVQAIEAKIIALSACAFLSRRDTVV